MNSIVITTERVNSNGFRVLSDGGDVTDYLRNPVLLYDHVRRQAENSNQIILPIGKLNNLRNINKSWLGDPEFDMSDTFARSVSNKFEKGYLNAASIGIEIIETSENPALLLPGQTLPTVTKWRLKEVSITDIPANADAVKLTANGDSLLCLNGRTSSMELRQFLGGVNRLQTLDTPQDLVKSLAAQWESRWRDGSLDGIRLSNPALYESLFQARFHKKLVNQSVALASLEKLSDREQYIAQLCALHDKHYKDGSLTKIRKENPKLYSEMFNAKFHQYKLENPD